MFRITILNGSTTIPLGTIDTNGNYTTSGNLTFSGTLLKDGNDINVDINSGGGLTSGPTQMTWTPGSGITSGGTACSTTPVTQPSPVVNF